MESDVIYWRLSRRGLGRVARMAKKHGTPVIFAASHVGDLKPLGAIRSARARRGPRAAELLVGRARALSNFGSLRRAAAVTVNNSEFLSLVPRGVRGVYVPNGVDGRREDFHWPRPFVAWVGNLKPSKRPEVTIDLADAIADLGVDVLLAGRIQVAGYDRFEEPERLPANLRYLGPLRQPQVNGLLRASLLHVHTCEPEGFPNVFIQAWAQGRPSISLGFDPGGIIRSERIGSMCDDDVEAFVGATRQYLLNSQLREAAGARAHRLASREFEPDTALDRLVALLEELV